MMIAAKSPAVSEVSAMLEKAQIEQLVESYKTAALALDSLSSAVEKQIGQAALRHNAAITLSHLLTRGVGISKPTIAPLQEWITHYRGGSTAETLVGGFDSAVNEIGTRTLKGVTAAVLSGSFIPLVLGSIGVIAGIGLSIIDVGQLTTEAVVKFLALGGSALYLAWRGVQILVEAASGVGGDIKESVQSAWSIGSLALAKLSDTSLPHERAVWTAVGGSPHPGTPFINRAQIRARIIVCVTIAIASIGALLFLTGVLEALAEINS